MIPPRTALMIIFGVTLSTRLNSVLSFGAMVACKQNAKKFIGVRTASASATTTLRGNNNDGDANGNSIHDRDKMKKNPKKSTVAIIGGGIAGLSCARHLQQLYDVTVYDTGRLRPGGRASSRQPNDRPSDDGENRMDYPLLSRFRFDHAAQFITSTKSKQTSWRASFDQQIQEWIDQDIVQESPPNSIYVFERENAKSSVKTGTTNGWNAKCLNPTSSTREQPRFFYPSRGMSSLVESLVTGSTFDVKQDVWVSPSSGVRYQGPPPPQGSMAKNGIGKDSWSVRAKGRTLGTHDHLIVAHNGKCADRLMSKTPAKDVHRLLRTNFNDRVPANGGQKMTLNSIYSLTFCVKAPSLLSQNLPESFVGAFIQDHPRLGLVTCQTNKYPTASYKDLTPKNIASDEVENLEVWTILSTASFAKKNKAPQEFLPEDVIQNVTRLLVDSLEKDIIRDIEGSEADSTESLRDQILESRLQLWGAAVPLNIWRGDENKVHSSSTDANYPHLGCAGFIHDPRYQVGVCGDWLLEASIAGAWTSGRRMAQYLIDIDHSSTTKFVGFKNGFFEASQSVRQLGLASLDGPMVSEKSLQSTPSSAQTNNTGIGDDKTNKRKNSRNRNKRRGRRQTSTA